MSIDTACSATLVAADGARRTVATASSTSSLAAGVNMMLTPGLTIILASGAFTSASIPPRCDGWVDEASAGRSLRAGRGSIRLASDGLYSAIHVK